ncbi:hypothetical protein PTKIN_Ptkin13bG0158100 [Pterospermum kingtungense]
MSSSAISIVVVVVSLIVRESTARELRPSDHGLGYQSLPPTGLKSPGMKSFFGASSTTPNTNTVALPNAMNSSGTSWWRSSGRDRRERDHLRHVLLLGSLVCGVTGVALLAASALIYVIKIRSSSSNNNNNTNNINVNSLVPISK